MDPSKESNLTSLLRPQFFCTRPNGCVTPLIALDELPPNISIRGTYRYLSPNETAGMTSVGTSEHRSQFYIVEGSHVNPVGTSVTTVAGESNMNDPHQRVFNAPNGSNWASRRTTPDSNFPKRNNKRNDQSRNPKKIYCSYWIRHGECDYQQQGCLYRHEMPNDFSVMERLGLRDIPKWYRDRTGIDNYQPQLPRSMGMRAQLAAMPQLPPNGRNGNSQTSIGQRSGRLAPLTWGNSGVNYVIPAPSQVSLPPEQAANEQNHINVDQPKAPNGNTVQYNKNPDIHLEDEAMFPRLGASPAARYLVSPTESSFPVRSRPFHSVTPESNDENILSGSPYSGGPVAQPTEKSPYLDASRAESLTGRIKKATKSRRLYEPRPTQSPNMTQAPPKNPSLIGKLSSVTGSPGATDIQKPKLGLGNDQQVFNGATKPRLYGDQNVHGMIHGAISSPLGGVQLHLNKHKKNSMSSLENGVGVDAAKPFRHSPAKDMLGTPSNRFHGI